MYLGVLFDEQGRATKTYNRDKAKPDRLSTRCEEFGHYREIIGHESF